MTDALEQLASLCGVETSFWDVVNHRLQPASPETLLGIFRALGVNISKPEQAADAARERRLSLWRRGAPPVAVAWEGSPAELELRLPAAHSNAPAACELQLETGEVRRWSTDLSRFPVEERAELEGASFVRKKLPLPADLPRGYHRLSVEIGKASWESLLIAAPAQAYGPPAERCRSWGVFLPLYALHSKRSWGVGDLTDLEALMQWVQELGGDLLATLPLLAGFLDQPLDPSPYSPVSRLFWNELYLDLDRVPELERSPAARALLNSPEFVSEREALRALPLVDYRRAMALKRRVLELLAPVVFEQPGERSDSFARFVETHPLLRDYARFRAVGERRGALWPDWPAELRDGRLREADYDEAARRYHLYAQWLAHQQMQALGGSARANGVELYLDLPLGVHRGGFDVWRERDSFALAAAGGAPPDPVFTSGQNWSFPPLHPERIRRQGYRYFIHSLRHQMQYAGLLRIDHVMGFHHLFWIPEGAEPGEGAYVRYPAEEFYAIVCLESHRNRCAVVGENLGLVPDYVNPTLARHNIRKMYIVQFELACDARAALRPIESDAVAGFNTHDMHPVAAYWEDRDLADRLRLGLLEQDGAQREREGRDALKRALVDFLRQGGWLTGPEADAAAVFAACVRYLAASRAAAVVVNLEDLWGAREPQNIPGSDQEHPNWRRKSRYSLEAFTRMPEVLRLLGELDRERKQGALA